MGALPATALTVLVATPLSVWWYGEPLYGDLVKILALGAPLAVLTLVMTTALQSVSRMNSIALVEVCAKTTHALLGIGAMVAGLGLTGLVSATIISQAVGCIIGLLAYQRILHRYHAFASLPAVVATAITVPWRAYFRFSALALVDKNIAALFERTPVLAPRPLHAAGAAAFYDAARKVLSFLAVFHGAVARKLRAALGERKGQVGLSGARTVFWRVTLLWTPLALALAAGLTLCLPLFRLALKPEVLPSLTLVIIFALHTGLMALGVGFGSVFLLTDRIGLNIAIKDAYQSGLPAPRCAAGDAMGRRGGGSLYAAAYSVGYVAYLSLLASNWFWQTSAPATRRSQPTGQRMKVLHVSPLFFGADGVVGAASAIRWSWRWLWPGIRRRGCSPSRSARAANDAARWTSPWRVRGTTLAGRTSTRSRWPFCRTSSGPTSSIAIRCIPS